MYAQQRPTRTRQSGPWPPRCCTGRCKEEGRLKNGSSAGAGRIAADWLLLLTRRALQHKMARVIDSFSMEETLTRK